LAFSFYLPTAGLIFQRNFLLENLTLFLSGDYHVAHGKSKNESVKNILIQLENRLKIKMLWNYDIRRSVIRDTKTTRDNSTKG
jgi:hypothetical protein